MKKITLLLLISLSLNIFAQKELKEGVITMKMNMSTDNEQAKAAFAMIGEIPVTVYFKEQKSRTEQKHQMTGNNITIVDSDSKKMLVLLDNPMLGKKYIENEIKVSEEDLKDITVTPTGDSKTIAGYTCNGYDIIAKINGIETKMIMYTTDKINVPTPNTAGLGNKIKGFPMYLILNTKQGPMDMIITMEVTEVKAEKIDDSMFALTIPEGYTKMEKPKPANVD